MSKDPILVNRSAGMESCYEGLEEPLRAFGFTKGLLSCERYGNGHINDTFQVIRMEEGKRHSYILQRINNNVFRNPKALMENISAVTAHLRKKILESQQDPERETLNLVSTEDGKSYFYDNSGNYWRVYLFIEGTKCFEQIEKIEDFYESGKAFGRFQKQLSDYPGEALHETIPDFHNTPLRMKALEKAIQEDVCGRVDKVKKEIQFVKERKQEMSLALEYHQKGELPLRVTHNDTKLNNILIDSETGKGLCVIDLDTVMPGFAIFDFGDAIRFGANMVAEDEQDLSKVKLSLPLFEIYVRGFLEECGHSLERGEIRLLPLGAKLMTMECGIRFLTDYLQGDIYFKTHRKEHNLDRARTQFTLAQDMESKWDKMNDIVNHAYEMLSKEVNTDSGQSIS